MSSGRRRGSSFAEGRRRRASSLDETQLGDSMITLDALEAAHQILQLLCQRSEDAVNGKSLLHATGNACKAKALLDRAHQLDYYTARLGVGKTKEGSATKLIRGNWMQSLLQQGDLESGYTPLHWAVFRAKLPVLLLLLRYCAAGSPFATTNSMDKSKANSVEEFMSVMSSTRMMHRPLALLQGDVSGAVGEQVKTIVSAKDNEGFTAFQLLEQLQTKELKNCRQSLARHNKLHESSEPTVRNGRQHRGGSFDWMLQQDHQEQNELAELHEFMDREQEQIRQENQRQAVRNDDDDDEINPVNVTYGCEVLAFGRANHLALGVQGGKQSSSATTNLVDGSDKSSTFRPQRVQQFAQDRVGRLGSAVAVAAAAHHTLVVTRQGHLFAFGVGTGGRLGTGDNERHCPAPMRVLGALAKRQVVAISAAENHSLCVTSDGGVYAWGSNRFGQLGYHQQATQGSDDPPSPSSSRCCLPRRVDDLWKKNVRCSNVAAGEKHSVALAQTGEVYVWGDNSAGQLGVSHRRSSGIIHKVQRVDALWNNDKRAFQIAASAQSTLALVRPNAGGLLTNQVYSWGHGTHVPSKVDFHKASESRHSTCGRSNHVNPVAIACARHHNAAISSDGRVYTWGLHSDPLGSSSSKQTSLKSNKAYSYPQLVTGMLPEEGGGFAVAVAASENHTAVVTDSGGLFTWGASYGKDVLGHEGVRWQPSPKRVSGVHRAVGLAVAKEHTILLVGASFPPLMDELSAKSTTNACTLELLAARQAARHVDLFNVLPVLMTAERTHSHALAEYCREFVRMNLDGVLNLGQKSAMDLYLREQLSIGLLLLDEEPRDRREHPLVMNMILAGKTGVGLFESEEILSEPKRWVQACEKIRNREPTKTIVYKMLRAQAEESQGVATSLYGRRRASSSIGSAAERSNRGDSANAPSAMQDLVEGKGRSMSSSERCLMLTSNMDLSSRTLVQTKYDSLTKEVRGVKKRLNQIAKLLQDLCLDGDSGDITDLLSPEQKEKVARRPHLESELAILNPALERVERSMRHYNLRLKEDETNTTMPTCLEENDEKPGDITKEEIYSPKKTEDMSEATPADLAEETTLRCKVCSIACPDEKSYALHMNGRKHRNRVAQAAEDEEKEAAAAIMEQRQLQQMKQMSATAGDRTPQGTSHASSVWSGSKSAHPKYKLPPPPHALPTSMETPQTSKATTSKSFQEILAEEAALASKTTPSATPKKTSWAPLQLPAGSAPALKSPPWATKKPQVQVSPMSLAMTSPQTPLKQAIKVKFPTPSSSSSSKKAASPAWGKTASPYPASAAPALPVMTSKDASSAKKPPSTSNQRNRSSSAPWATPQVSQTPSVASPGQPKRASAVPAKPVPVTAAVSASSVRFQDIQQAEQAFKQVQDQSFVDNGKWFIQRRERAGSFAKIQEIADQEREQQLLIEEQLRIEQEIQRTNALQKQQEEQQRRKEQQTKKNKKKKTQPQQKQTEGEDATKSKARNSNNNKPKGRGNHQKAKPPNAAKDPQQGDATGATKGQIPTAKRSNGNRRNRNRNRNSNNKSGGAQADQATCNPHP